MINEFVLARIKALQQELEELEKVVAHQVQGKVGKVNLKGIWKGVVIQEGDLEEAKKALFKDAYYSGE